MRVSLVNFTGARSNWGCQATSWELARFAVPALEKTAPVTALDLVPLLPVCEIDQQIEAEEGARIDNAFLEADPGRRDCPHLRYLEDLCVRRYGPWAAIVQTSDVVLFQGEGTMTGTDFVRGARLLLLPFVAAALWKKPTISLNQTLFICNPAFEPVAQKVYGFFNGVAVREPMSVKFADLLGFPEPYLLPDTAFTTRPEDPSREVTLPKNTCFAVTGTAFSAAGETEAIFAAADELKRRTGYKAIVLASTKADRRLAQWARTTWKKGSFAVLPERMTYRHVAGALAECSLLLGGRYHMSLLAASQGTPIVTLRGNTFKNEGLLELLDWPAEALPAAPPQRVLEQCFDVLKHREAMSQQLLQARARIYDMIADSSAWLAESATNSASPRVQARAAHADAGKRAQERAATNGYADISWRQSQSRRFVKIERDADLFMDRAEAKRLMGFLDEMSRSDDPMDRKISSLVLAGNLSPVTDQIAPEALPLAAMGTDASV